MAIEKSDFKILVVEDDENLREMLEMSFETEGYRVLLAEDGAVALQQMEKGVDFILSDVRMPNTDGVEMLKKIRALNPDVPIVLLMSGFTDVSGREAKELGALDLITKPFRTDRIIEIIEKIRIGN